MEEKLYTIPLTEAFEVNDECPLCFVERKIENELLDFVLGSASTYMEDDVRASTDSEGFCKTHFKKMFDYGNSLGCGWILKTHYEKIQKELKQQIKLFAPSKVSFMDKLKGGKERDKNSIALWAEEKDSSCYICSRFHQTYIQRMLSREVCKNCAAGILQMRRIKNPDCETAFYQTIQTMSVLIFKRCSQRLLCNQSETDYVDCPTKNCRK